MTLLLLTISDVLLLLILVVLMQNKRKQDDIVSSARHTTEHGEKILKHMITLPLDITETWAIFASPSGFRSFLSPIADIKVIIGGKVEPVFDDSGSFGGDDHMVLEITGYLPFEMICMRITSTPQGFPNPEIAKHLIIVIQMVPRSDDKTTLIYSMLGWKEGRVWNDFYEFFDYTNQLILKNLAEKAESAVKTL